MRKILSILLLTTVLFGGCKPSYQSSDTYQIIDSDDLKAFIVKTNKIEAVGGMAIMPDPQYAVPTIEWVKKHYLPQLATFIFENQLRTPGEVGNDCDKYAQYGVTVGHIMHRHSKNHPKDAALSIGEIFYISGIVGHAVNFFVVTDNGVLKLVFVEPQTQQIMNVDPTDIAVLYWKM